MTIRRRDCLTLFGLAAGIGMAPMLSASTPRKIERIGLQLYTVRDAMAKDVAATLATVAKAGYLEVETAGTGSLSAEQFSIALANTGLTAPSAHVMLKQMAEQPDELLALAETIGYQYLVLPWLAPEQRSASGYAQVIDTLNRFGERCTRAGVQLCYHNHDFEFQTIGGELPYNLLLRECDSKFVRFELDLFWAVHAGVDPITYLRADPERFPLCHVKDRNAAGEMVDVGQGNINFSAMFSAGTGLKHHFVEHDQPADSLASIRNSIQAVQKIRF